MKRILLLALAAIVVSACAPSETPAAPAAATIDLADVSVDLYHSPGCTCCMGWVAYISEFGATVSITELDDLGQFKTDAGVPTEAGSCHTAIVNGYVVEGHVPASAITRLLTDRPDIVGIALPGMPADSPGMGGGPATWANQPVVSIDGTGVLTPFTY